MFSFNYVSEQQQKWHECTFLLYFKLVLVHYTGFGHATGSPIFLFLSWCFVSHIKLMMLHFAIMLLLSHSMLFQDSIVDITEGFVNWCTSSSQIDYGIITKNGIYFYDDYTDMTSPPCRTEVDVTSVFTGYSNLPDVTSWDAVMTFQQNYIDVYSGEATPP